MKRAEGLNTLKQLKVETFTLVCPRAEGRLVVFNDGLFGTCLGTFHGLSVSMKCLQPPPCLLIPALPKIRFEEKGVEIVKSWRVVTLPSEKM